jgi:hypothetical protein
MADVIPRLTRTPGSVRWTGADGGAHTHVGLTELGLTASERQALAAAGVIPRPA